nr:MAG TPA: hypothetical protein [Caudoviricetes sp.]
MASAIFALATFLTKKQFCKRQIQGKELIFIG